MDYERGDGRTQDKVTHDGSVGHTLVTMEQHHSSFPSPDLYTEDQFTFRQSAVRVKCRGDESARIRSESLGTTVAEGVTTDFLFKGSGNGKDLVIHPHSFLRIAWEVVFDVLVVYSLITSAYYLAFATPSFAQRGFDYFVWAFFVCDIIVRFNTGFFDEEGQLVVKRKRIVARYMLSWFVVDITAVLPLSAIGSPEAEYYTRLLRFARLPNSCSFVDGTGLGAVLSALVHRLPELRIGEFRVGYYYLSLMLQHFLRLLLLTYFLACAFMWLSAHAELSHIEGDERFVDSVNGDLPHSKLLKAAYFILTTLATIGYGDFLPGSSAERVFVIGLLFLGIANFSVVIGEFVALIGDLNSINSSDTLPLQASAWLHALEVSTRPVPQRLHSRIFLYFSHYSSLDRLHSLSVSWWQCETLPQSPADRYFPRLPESLRRMVLVYLYADLFGKYRRFFGFPQSEFAYAVAHHFQPRWFAPGEAVVEEGSDAEEVLLLTSGRVHSELRCGGRSHSFLSFSEKLVIGEYAALTSTQVTATFRAAEAHSCVQAVAIPQSPFVDLLDLDPLLKASALQRASIFHQSLLAAKRDFIAKQRGAISAEKSCTGSSAARVPLLKSAPERYQLAVFPNQKRTEECVFDALLTHINASITRLTRGRVPMRERLHCLPPRTQRRVAWP